MIKKSQITFTDLLKNLFFILVIVQLAPRLIKNIGHHYRFFIEHRTKVAVVPIKGILYDSEPYCRLLQKLFKDTAIKAILITMECPGGASGTSQSIYSELKALKATYPKPVVVLVENICASGGYNIACACDHIVAPGSAIIGSIGTSLPYLFNVKDLLEQFKIKYTPIKAGSFKNVTNPFVDMTAEETSMLQNLANDSYEQFILEVSEQRKLSLAKVKEWADGKIFTGKQAKALGLIDEIGSLTNAIKAIQQKAMFEGAIEWIREPRKISFWNFFSGLDGEQQESSTFISLCKELCCSVKNLMGN